MLPCRIILAILASLISQGEVVHALPQGPPNYSTRFEHLNGRTTGDAISKRHPAPTVNVIRLSLSAGNELRSRKVDTEKVELAALGLGAAGLAIGGINYFLKKTARGKKIGELTKASVQQVKEVAKTLWSKIRPGSSAARVFPNVAALENELNAEQLELQTLSPVHLTPLPPPSSSSGSSFHYGGHAKV